MGNLFATKIICFLSLLAFGVSHATGDCSKHLDAIVSYGLNRDIFDPSHILQHPPHAPLAILRVLYKDLVLHGIPFTGAELLEKAIAALERSGTVCETGLPPAISLGDWAKLAEYLGVLHRYAESDARHHSKEVLVVGSGPIGLFHALEAHALGGTVTVMEKRNTYTRNMWFDLGPSSWYDTLAQIDLLGLNLLDLDIVKPLHQAGATPSADAVVLRCQTLQRVLAKTCSIIGIEIRFNRVFNSVHADTDDKRLVATFMDLLENREERVRFDIMIAADGAQSAIRTHFGLAYLRQDRFYIDKRIPVDVKGLHQPTLLVNLKPNSKGECPKLKTSADDDDELLESLETGMLLPGITHTFRRFYHGHCHLQVLFTSDNSYIQTTDGQFEIPWPLLFNVTTFLLDSPYKDIEQLQYNVLSTELDGYTPKYDIEFFNIEIRKIGRSLIQPRPVDSQSLVLFVGDASITAHYRMGVGINNGVRQLQTSRTVLQGFPLSEADLQAVNLREMAQLDELSLFETWLIGSEAYCDYVVGLETSKPRYSFSTWLRDRQAYKDGRAYLEPLHGVEILSNCERLAQ